MTILTNGAAYDHAPISVLVEQEATDQVAWIRERIDARDAVVGIVGLGYVGLPLALAFAESGFRVLGLDVDQRRVDSLSEGLSPVGDVSSASIAALVTSPLEVCTAFNRCIGDDGRKRGSLSFTTDFDLAQHVDAAIICVPTPLSASRDPDMSYVIDAATAVGAHLRPGGMVILESTTYPGTTEELVLPILAGPDSARRVGEDFFLAFSPERIDPGRTDHTVRTTPKVVGGVTPACTTLAAHLYGSAIDRVVPVSQPRSAEMVKLLENTFRMLNIGLANELAMMCDKLDVDVWEVIDAAATKPFGFMPFYPGPGLGGHCIPVDPHYLAWKMRSIGYNPRFIQVASEMNQAMPEYVLEKVSRALNDDAKPLKGSKVLVLGVAYKANIADVRESPALDIITLLRSRGAEVTYHDDHVASLRVDGITMQSTALVDALAQDLDCAVVVTAHDGTDWHAVVERTPLVVDTRNALAVVPPGRARVVTL